MRLGDAQALKKIAVIPTGALGWTWRSASAACPGAGWWNFWAGILRQDHLMLHVIANAKKAEGSLLSLMPSTRWIGLCQTPRGKPGGPARIQPDSGEEALTICETLARSNALDVIVIDSVAALVPKAELEGEMGMATMGMQARLMSQALRKLTAILAKAKTTCVFTNQIREKVGVMFGNPERRPAEGAQILRQRPVGYSPQGNYEGCRGQCDRNHVKVKWSRTR